MRKIWIDKVEDLDLQNLGCHWTRNFQYSHNGGGSNGLTEKRAIEVRVIAEVAQSQINLTATEFSNESHPSEKEVVLNANTKINAEYEFIVNGKILGGYGSVHKSIANTGTRVDTWVKNLK